MGKSGTADEADYPRIYTAREVAAILKVGVDTVYRKLEGGRLPPPLQYSRLLRWNGDEFDQWVRDGCPEMRRSRAKRPKGKERNTR